MIRLLKLIPNQTKYSWAGDNSTTNNWLTTVVLTTKNKLQLTFEKHYHEHFQKYTQ